MEIERERQREKGREIEREAKRARETEGDRRSDSVEEVKSEIEEIVPISSPLSPCLSLSVSGCCSLSIFLFFCCLRLFLFPSYFPCALSHSFSLSISLYLSLPAYLFLIYAPLLSPINYSSSVTVSRYFFHFLSVRPLSPSLYISLPLSISLSLCLSFCLSLNDSDLIINIFKDILPFDTCYFYFLFFNEHLQM